jgi:hypothetical protein
MKTNIGILTIAAGVGLSAQASLYQFGTLQTGGSPIGTIADNSSIGLSSSYVVSGENTSLSGMTLTFVLQGGTSSDLTGYLRLGDTTSSPAYDLTDFLHSYNLSAGTPTTYSISFADPAFQSTFGDLDPNGSWTLYFADLSSGDQTTLNGWSLNITAVPEPVESALVGFAALAASGWGIKRFKARR